MQQFKLEVTLDDSEVVTITYPDGELTVGRMWSEIEGVKKFPKAKSLVLYSLTQTFDDINYKLLDDEKRVDIYEWTGDSPPDESVKPTWSSDKDELRHDVTNRMKQIYPG